MRKPSECCGSRSGSEYIIDDNEPVTVLILQDIQGLSECEVTSTVNQTTSIVPARADLPIMSNVTNSIQELIFTGPALETWSNESMNKLT